MALMKNRLLTTEVEVRAFAREYGESFGKTMGQPTSKAEKKLRAITQAFLDAMEIGEEQQIPLRSNAGELEILTIKKIGESTFETTAQSTSSRERIMA